MDDQGISPFGDAGRAGLGWTSILRSTSCVQVCLSCEPYLPTRNSSVKLDLQSVCFYQKRKLMISFEVLFKQVAVEMKNTE